METFIDMDRYEYLVRKSEQDRIKRRMKYVIRRVSENIGLMLLGVLIVFISYKIGFSSLFYDSVTGKYDATWFALPIFFSICIECMGISGIYKLFK